MKSRCALALAAGAYLLLCAAPAAGQYAPRLLPLPPVAPLDAVTASFDTPGTVHDPYTSIFSQETLPQPRPDEQLLTGPDGVGAFEEAVESEWLGDCCGDCCGRRGAWFGGVGGLMMGRNRPNPFWTTYETNNNANQLFNTQNAGADWSGGWAITGGYLWGCPCPQTDCCSCAGAAGAMGAMGLGGFGGPGCCSSTGPGVMFSYWGLAPMNGFGQINSPANELSTPIDLNTQTGSIDINGVPTADYFDNAASHRITRADRINNFELNFLLGAYTFRRLTFLPLVGLRYFRFDEQLNFYGLAGGGDWNNPDDWACHSNRVANNMWGAQFGTYVNFMLCDRVGLFVGPKVGLFGNQMNGRTLLYDGNGVLALDENGNPYNIAAHKVDFSLMGELDAGFLYFFRPNLFTYLGYRVIGISNIALSDNQYLTYEADVAGFAQIKQNGSLILSGAMFGGGFLF